MERILSAFVMLALLTTGVAQADPSKDTRKKLDRIKQKAWKASTAYTPPARNFNLEQAAPVVAENGVEIPYPPGQVQLDAQEAEDF